MSARATRPPTTPPTIAPVFEEPPPDPLGGLDPGLVDASTIEVTAAFTVYPAAACTLSCMQTAWPAEGCHQQVPSAAYGASCKPA